MFIIMSIDDLPNVVQHSTISLYADDAKMNMNVNNMMIVESSSVTLMPLVYGAKEME